MLGSVDHVHTSELQPKSDLLGKLGLELMQNDSFWNEFKVNVSIRRKSKLPSVSPFLPGGYIPNNKTPCNSVYIIVYIQVYIAHYHINHVQPNTFQTYFANDNYVP